MSSPAFAVRASVGSCYFCAATFAVGDRAFYMTATAAGNAPERPLTPAEERTARAHGRAVAAARRSRSTIPTGPAWLWERMVHPACATGAGFPAPRGETDARRGTRTEGHAHGVATVDAPATVAMVATMVEAVAPTAAPPVEAPEPVAVGAPGEDRGRWAGLELD